MTREHKLALIIGFSLVLVVGVLISDHFSKARSSPLATEIAPGTAERFGADTRGMRVVSASAPGPTIITPPEEAVIPPGLLPPTNDQVAQTPGGSVDIVMGVPQPLESSESLLQKAIGPGNGTALVQPGQVMPVDPGAGTGVRPIDPLTGTPTPSGGGLASPGGPQVMPEMPIVTRPTAPPAPEVRKEELVNGVPVKMMTRHDVREGESAYRIAQEKYGDGKLWTKLVEYNKGKMNGNGGVREGVTLLLPPKEALLGKPLPSPETATVPGSGTRETARAAAKTPEKSETKPAKTEKPAAKTYTVQKGDSLSEIARRTLGSTKRWNEIVAMNRGVLDDEDSLVVGTVLKLPAR